MHQLPPAHQLSLHANGGSSRSLTTADGPMDVYCFSPEGEPGLPLLFFSDAGGVRPGMFEIARRLANAGHEVMLPNLYHRLGSYAPFDPATVFGDEAEMARLLAMTATITEAGAMADARACLQALGEGPAGVLGFCLGGGLALRCAAHFPARITAAASIHGGGLATDASDSPHRLASKIRARIYLGVAGIDPFFGPEQQQRLETALQSAGTDYDLQVYKSARHGFAVPDVPAYEPAAAEANWKGMTEFFAART